MVFPSACRGMESVLTGVCSHRPQEVNARKKYWTDGTPFRKGVTYGIDWEPLCSVAYDSKDAEWQRHLKANGTGVIHRVHNVISLAALP